MVRDVETHLSPLAPLLGDFPPPLSIVHGLGEIEGILVGERTDLSSLVSSSKSSCSNLVHGKGSVQDIGWGVSSHLLELDWHVDLEELIKVKEPSSDSN